MTTDHEQSYVSVLKTLDAGIHSAYVDHDYGHLSRIDSYHSRIRHFLYSFKGISSRWLMQYLGWQKLTEVFRESLFDRFILGRILRGRYRTTRAAMYHKQDALDIVIR